MANIDLDYFETIMMYNALKDDTYLSCIIDYTKPEYFGNPDISSIFGVLVDFYKERSKLPSLTEIKIRLTSPDLKKSFVSVAQTFRGMDTAFDKAELLANTEHYLRQRAVYNAILKSAQLVQSGKADPSETLKMFEEACNINLFHDFGIDMINRIDEYIDKIKVTTSYFSTGFPWLDKMIKGLAKDGKALYVVSAATNVGKSILLTNIACNVAKQNKKVVLFTLEMSEEMYGNRCASCLTKLPIGDLVVNADTLLQDVIQIQNENPNACLFIKEFPTKGASVATLKAYIKKLYDTKHIKPDLIVVDYLNLLRPTTITGKSYEDIKSITEELRGMSYAFGGIPILSATQLNRGSINEANPGLEFTSESMGLSMTADVQVCLWASDEDKELGYLHIGMQKNRFGPNFGKSMLKIDWNNLSLEEANDSIYDSEDLQSTKSILDGLR